MTGRKPMPKPLASYDISKLKVLETRDYQWVRHTVYEIERIEMPTKVKHVTLIVTEETAGGFMGYWQALNQKTQPTAPTAPATWKETRRRRTISIRKKYLAIGGPLDGQMVVSTDAKEYTFFIRHVGGRRNKIPTGVLIHSNWLGVRTGLEW